MESLLKNRWTQSHFWLIALYFHKNTIFFTYTLSWFQQHFFNFNIFDFGVFVVCWSLRRRQQFSTNHRALIQNCAITQPRIPCPIGRWSHRPRLIMVTLPITRGRGKQKNQSDAEMAPTMGQHQYRKRVPRQNFANFL